MCKIVLEHVNKEWYLVIPYWWNKRCTLRNTCFPFQKSNDENQINR